MAFANKVQLITYPDSLGGDLRSLRGVLASRFNGCFPGGIHVLPPFPSSGDRGFAPITYAEIEPRFGSWADIAALGEAGPVMLDLMVNHVSRKSAPFTDFLKRGRASAYADLFLDVARVWPDGKPEPEELARLFLRRPAPWSDYRLATGETARVWTTFGREDPSEQVDLDFGSASAMRLVTDTLAAFGGHGVRMARLDAVGYIVKRAGTSCFFVEPEIWDVMGRLRAAADGLGIDLLCEVHAPAAIQRKLSEHGYWGYDFRLPFIVLEALIRRDSGGLARYLGSRPPRLFTMLDCHDGIPVLPDLDGLVDERAAAAVVDLCVSRGANVSRIHSDAHKGRHGLDAHQIRCTYPSALGGDEDAYVAARALQLFAPGIPQVYYVGLLAGENDLEGASRSGEGRDVNRRNYSLAEIERAVDTEVVRRLLRLIRLRNACPAFDGSFTVSAEGPSTIELRWSRGSAGASLALDLGTYAATVTEQGDDGVARRWKA
jgi:sucrose 6(F)-phosphate phosphorylase